MSKLLSFMIFIWLIVTVAGGIFQGSSVVGATALTADITDVSTTVSVVSTDGFSNSGFIVVLDEKIGYSSKTATTFTGSLAKPMVRGASGTEAIAHVAGEVARTTESSMLNDSLGYNLAVLSDSSGILAFVTIPLAFLSLLATFFTLPLAFLGTDLQILVYIWAVISISVFVTIGIQFAGGRRMS